MLSVGVWSISSAKGLPVPAELTNGATKEPAAAAINKNKLKKPKAEEQRER
jgi:hypothetical protein